MPPEFLATENIGKGFHELKCQICLIKNQSVEDSLLIDINDTGQMLKCQMCYATVHTKCFGVPYTLNFNCDRCSTFKLFGIRPKCCLCTEEQGIMRRLDNTDWVHFVCVKFFPEIYP